MTFPYETGLRVTAGLRKILSVVFVGNAYVIIFIFLMPWTAQYDESESNRSVKISRIITK